MFRQLLVVLLKQEFGVDALGLAHGLDELVQLVGPFVNLVRINSNSYVFSSLFIRYSSETIHTQLLTNSHFVLSVEQF